MIGTTSRGQWVKWINELQAISLCGLTYSKDPYDLQRFKQLQKLTAEISADITDKDAEIIHNFFERETGYATPKLDLRAGIFKDTKVLLVRERRDQKWTLPGGWADVNESPSEGVAREVVEETGYTVNVIKLVGLLDKMKQNHPPQFPHTYKAFFLCEIVSGEPTLNIEIDAIDFFELNNLPKLCPHRISPEEIQLCYKHYLNRNLPTNFD